MSHDLVLLIASRDLEQLGRSPEGRATVHVERASTRNQTPHGATAMGAQPLDLLARSTIGECRLLGSLQPSNERGNVLRRPISFRISCQGPGKSTENFSPRNKFRALFKSEVAFLQGLKGEGVSGLGLRASASSISGTLR